MVKIERPAPTGYISDETLYLDDKGNVVGEDDPNKLTKIVHEGTEVTVEMAQKYGLPRSHSKLEEIAGNSADVLTEPKRAKVAAKEKEEAKK